MTVTAMMSKVDGERVAATLDEIRGKLDDRGGGLVLDFSAVRRLDAAGVAALEKLATAAEAHDATIALRGVNVEVYKVLKLVKLAPRFEFLT